MWVHSLFCFYFSFLFSQKLIVACRLCVTACMDYMDPDVRCPKTAVKVNHPLTSEYELIYCWNIVVYVCELEIFLFVFS